jgi:hypothetical protein
VLNTEAHPFPRFDASKKRFKTGWERLPRNGKGEIASEKVDGRVKGKDDEVEKEAVGE